MKEALAPSQDIKRIAPTPIAPDRDFSDKRNDDISPAEDEHRERIEALREWTCRYLEERFPEYGPDTESDFIKHCRQSGFKEALSANRPGNSASETDGRNISIDSAATEAFLHEVINIMRKHSDDREVMARFQESLSENSRLDHWALENLDDTGFISVYTDYERSAGISEPAVETPFPLMRTYFADRFASMNESDLRNLADDLSERSPGERIDIIRFLPVPISLDEDDFEPPKNVREEYRKRFRFVLERLADTDIAAIRFSALNRLADQEAYWHKCDEAGGEDFLEYEEVSSKKEADLPKSLERRIVPDKQLPYYYSAGRVATDAIAFFDGPGFPRYIAHAPSERLDRFESMAPSTDWSTLTDLRRELRKMSFTSITEIRYVLSEVEKALFEEETRSDSDSLAREFSEISNTLDEPFWKAYFELKKELDRLLKEDWEQTQTLERNFEAKRDALKAQIEEITRKHKEEQSDGSGLAETLPETIHSLLKQDTTDLNKHLSQIFQSHAQNKELEVAKKHRDALLDTILTRGETFRKDLLTYLDRKLESAEEAGAFIKTHLNSYEKIQKDPTLDPFGAIDPESLRLIQALHSPDAKDFLGMDFSKLPLRAQIHFLSFRGKEKTSDAERFRLALGKHEDIADDLAYSFLATSEGPEYGETILSLAERFDTETLGPILQKYAEITKDTDTVSDYVRESFPNLGPEEVERKALEISKNLLRRGRDLLVDFSKSTDADPETLLQKLGEARTDIILYKTAFRTLHESGSKEDLAEMMKSEIASLQGTELSADEQEDLLSIYDRNYPESEQYPAEFREKIFEGLRTAFRNPDSRFYLLRREREIIGFRRFDGKGETEDGKPRKYAGSFNVDSAFRDAKIGDVFYQVTLEQEGADSVIEAYVDPEAPVVSFYVERYGYVIDGVTDIEGKPFLTMKRDLETNVSFATREPEFDAKWDIPKYASEINGRLSSVSIREIDRADLFALVKEMTSQGWTLTRLPYGEGGRDGGKVIAVFENPSLRKRVANVTAKETTPEAA